MKACRLGEKAFNLSLVSPNIHTRKEEEEYKLWENIYVIQCLRCLPPVGGDG